MDREKENYADSIKEHTDICVRKLDKLSEDLAKSKLVDNDFYAIERLLQILIEVFVS